MEHKDEALGELTNKDDADVQGQRPGPRDGPGRESGEDGIILSTLALLISPISNPKTEQENPPCPNGIKDTLGRDIIQYQGKIVEQHQ